MGHSDWPYLIAAVALGLIVVCLIVWEPVVAGFVAWKTERAFRQRDLANRTKEREW
ncbi:MAG: hypothetical protein LDL33_11335 [Desulfomonile sp.]|nr:hypothetical protein [Desulfomonile sp.]